MGNHRGERSSPRRRSLGGRTDRHYVGRRVAGRESHATTTYDVATTTPAVSTAPARVVVEPVVDLAQLEAPTSPGAVPTPATSVDATTYYIDRPEATEKARPVGHVGRRGPLFKHLPSSPVALGVAVLALAVGGTVASGNQTALANNETIRLQPVSAVTGVGGVGSVSGADDRRGVSRDSDRQALQQASAQELRKAAEQQAEERNAALGQLAAKAERTAKQMQENLWVLPVRPSETTATFGETGLWASYHTGLDFNGETGDPIHAVAAGEVTFVGYDGAYGNKIVVTLEDGTELWYCHLTSASVSVGDQVASDEVIGAMGSTGNSTGSHLHLEVRPGGGDPVDPGAALRVHGVTP